MRTRVSEEEMERASEEAAEENIREILYYAEHGRFMRDYKPDTLYQQVGAAPPAKDASPDAPAEAAP